MRTRPTNLLLLMIYEINHIWTAEMKWKWRNDCRSELNLCNCVKKPEKKKRNCINCVHGDDHFFIFISFPQFIYDVFHISLTLISFTGTKEPTIDLLPTSVAKIAQLVEHRTGIARSRVQTSVKFWIFFRLHYAIA